MSTINRTSAAVELWFADKGRIDLTTMLAIREKYRKMEEALKEIAMSRMSDVTEYIAKEALSFDPLSSL